MLDAEFLHHHVFRKYFLQLLHWRMKKTHHPRINFSLSVLRRFSVFISSRWVVMRLIAEYINYSHIALQEDYFEKLMAPLITLFLFYMQSVLQMLRIRLRVRISTAHEIP